MSQNPTDLDMQAAYDTLATESSNKTIASSFSKLMTLIVQDREREHKKELKTQDRLNQLEAKAKKYFVTFFPLLTIVISGLFSLLLLAFSSGALVVIFPEWTGEDVCWMLAGLSGVIGATGGVVKVSQKKVTTNP